jgi:hypothetical protein
MGGSHIASQMHTSCGRCVRGSDMFMSFKLLRTLSETLVGVECGLQTDTNMQTAVEKGKRVYYVQSFGQTFWYIGGGIYNLSFLLRRVFFYNKWHFWNGKHYEEDPTGAYVRFVMMH